MVAAQALMPEVDFAHDELPNLHDLLDELRRQGPVVPVTYHGETAWLINGYAELRQAFSDEEHFQGAAAYRIHSEPSMGKTIQTMAGEEHRINRGLVSKAFFPGAVRAMVEDLLEPVARELLRELAGSEEVDLVQAFIRPYPFRVITRLLGIPIDDEGRLLEWALKLIDFPWDPEGALRAREDFSEYMTPILAQRRQQPADDLVSQLATAEFEGSHLADEEILAFLRLLFPAGSDTTYKVGGSLFLAVMQDPALRQQAMAGDGEREALVQEALRWQPPTALLPRMCSKDTQLGGVNLRAGDWVLFGITAANSDPQVFPEPRRFDPARDNKNLAFGHGVHFCLGSHLARRELEAELKTVFEAFPHMTLLEQKPAVFSGAVLRGVPELWVRPGG